jgi:hypothetical protein
MPSTARRTALKETYGFDAWPAPDAATMFLHFWNYHPEPSTWRDVKGVETRRALALGRALVARAYHAVMGGGRVVSVSVGEHSDGRAARDSLLDILSTSMAPRLPAARERGLDVGEVAYVDFGDPLTWVVFVRGNLLVDVRSIGSDAVAVADIALVLARGLEVTPADTEIDMGPEISSFVLGGSRAARGALVPLGFDYRDRGGERLMVRLISTAGPFSRRDGTLWVQAARTGVHDVKLVLESADGRIASRIALLEVGP